LGFLVNPLVIFSKLPLIILLTITILILKAVIVFFVSVIFGYKGKTAIANSLGLAQVGEFSFIIFSVATTLKLISPENTSLGIAVTLLTLIAAPFLVKSSLPLWRIFRELTSKIPFLASMFATGEKRTNSNEILENHIIICGYGRVGKWIGKAFQEFSIPFVVVDYNQRIVNDLKESGISVLYGDPTEPEVLEAAGIREAKALILAIPDHVAQETLITYTQSVSPNTKIISRVHLDEDWNKLKILRVDKIVQPEFEAAIAIVRSVLINIGKSKEEIQNSIKSLRISHAK
jgi:CPA2 family monovalent cation:H+ antiporter-2